MLKRHFSVPLTLSLLGALAPLATGATPIDRSTITQVVKDVSVIPVATKSKKPARVSEVFAVPDIMRTGPDSRAEMIADDQTVTRVGANTLFSFEAQKREVNLQRGSILFNSPGGKGGGTIKTAAATASVLGTTLIVVTTKNGGFKVLLLEGTGKVRSENGQTRSLSAGQMTFALPGGALSPVMTFQLGEQVGGSRLVNGFRRPLPSKDKIEKAIAKQNAALAKGQLIATGLLASDDPSKAFRIDPNSRDVLIRAQDSGGEVPADAGVFASDAIVASADLEQARIIRLDQTEAILAQAGVSDLFAEANADFTLFAARNTIFRTASVDLAPFQPTSAFVFLSLQNITVEQTLTIDSVTPLVFLAGGAIDFAPDAGLSLSAPEITILSLGVDPTAGGQSTSAGLTLSGVGSFITNHQDGGSLLVLAPSVKLLDGASLNSSGSVSVQSLGNVVVSSPLSSVVLTPFGPTGNTQLLALDSVTVQAQGNVNLQNTVAISQNTQIIAQQGDFVGVNVLFDYPTDQASAVTRLQGNNLLSLTNAAFNALDVSLQAQTIVLRNVSFHEGSRVVLDSASGRLAPNPNTNQPVRLGDVNFIQNVRHGQVPAEVAVRGGSITIR